ncbi:MAG: acetyl-CoA carboxylase biotin carboxyl carrier protein subunit [Opitutae bacterium]|nr:acetyl-CoA carboxylase biotin carboxyl carrier protein subunit [Opitutae bacterium]
MKAVAKAAATGDLKTFRVDCQTYQTKLTTKFENRCVWEAPNWREVCAYIPGSVLEVFVKEGQSLTAGTALLRFEAMKMECVITMPYDGVVKKVHVKAGDRFPKNQTLVEIDE